MKRYLSDDIDNAIRDLEGVSSKLTDMQNDLDDKNSYIEELEERIRVFKLELEEWEATQ
jgi:uncharacterized protein YgfB (UPF0149 family)